MDSVTVISQHKGFVSLPAQPASRAGASGPKIRFGGLTVISLASIGLALATASECHSIFYPPSLLYGFVLWGWWGFLASVLWKLGPRFPAMLRFSPVAIASHLLVSIALGVIHLVLLGSLGFMNAAWKLHGSAWSVLTGMLHINRFGIEILIYGFIFGLIGIIQIQVRVQRDAMRSLELEKQLSEAHLQALQMQLEPHFLFNTLNAITTLVELGRQKQAAAMLSHLNIILKGTLKRTAPEKVPLSQELEILENYLAIEQIRFADRLQVELKIDPSTLDGLVPCFLLQPIVENAIRHGIAHCVDSGFIEASAQREGDFLHLLVRDSGSGRSSHAKPGNGIGLRNTRERLAHFYRDAYDMKAQPLGLEGFEVSIHIPYERS